METIINLLSKDSEFKTPAPVNKSTKRTQHQNEEQNKKVNRIYANNQEDIDEYLKMVIYYTSVLYWNYTHKLY